MIFWKTMGGLSTTDGKLIDDLIVTYSVESICSLALAGVGVRKRQAANVYDTQYSLVNIDRTFDLATVITSRNGPHTITEYVLEGSRTSHCNCMSSFQSFRFHAPVGLFYGTTWANASSARHHKRYFRFGPFCRSHE